MHNCASLLHKLSCREFWPLCTEYSSSCVQTFNVSCFKDQPLYVCEMQEMSRLTLPSGIDVTSQQLIFWEFSTHISVISATTFIKNGPNFAPPRLFQAPRLLKSRNQVVQLPITPLFQSPHHSKLKSVFDFYIAWK